MHVWAYFNNDREVSHQECADLHAPYESDVRDAQGTCASSNPSMSVSGSCRRPANVSLRLSPELMPFDEHAAVPGRAAT